MPRAKSSDTHAADPAPVLIKHQRNFTDDSDRSESAREDGDSGRTEIRRRPSDLYFDVDWTKGRRRLGVRANGGAALLLCTSLWIVLLGGLYVAAKHYGWR